MGRGFRAAALIAVSLIFLPLGASAAQEADPLSQVTGYLAGLTQLSPEQIAALDQNGDGRLTLADAALLQLESGRRPAPAVTLDAHSDSEQEGALSVTLTLSDPEGLLTGDALATLSSPGAADQTKALPAGTHELVFAGVTEEAYTLKVTAGYEYVPGRFEEDATLLEEDLNVEGRYLELHDITGVRVLTLTNGAVAEAPAGTVTEENRGDYVAEVSSAHKPPYYAAIRAVLPDGRLALDTGRFVSYSGGARSFGLTVSYPYSSASVGKGLPERLSALPGYDGSKIMVYQNLYKLMPYYDAGNLIRDGGKVNDPQFSGDILMQVYPLDGDGAILYPVTEQNLSQLKKLRLCWLSSAPTEYAVTPRSFRDHIAAFDVPDLGACYTCPAPVANADGAAVAAMAEMLAAFPDYPSVGGVSTESEYGIYADEYRDKLASESGRKALALRLACEPAFGTYLDHPVLTAKLNAAYGAQLKDLLHCYTYVSRWYGFDMGGFTAADALFFNALGLFPDATPQALSAAYHAAAADIRGGNRTEQLYNKAFSRFTYSPTVAGFVESLACDVLGDTDPADWFAAHVNAVVAEAPSGYRTGEAEYRAWSYVKENYFNVTATSGSSGALVLPILSYPGDDLFLISMPTQLCIGSGAPYGHSSATAEKRQDFQAFIFGFAQNAGTYYTTLLSMQDGFRRGVDSAALFNTYRCLEFDRRTGEDSPLIRYLYGPLRAKDDSNLPGVQAVTRGGFIYWNEGYMLYNFLVFTHETAHMEHNLFYGYPYGTDLHKERLPLFGEDLTDGVFSQGSYGGGFNAVDGLFHFNLVKTLDFDSDATQNLTPGRISSPEQVASFYKNMFEALDLIDYLEAQAFLRLPPERQMQIARVYEDFPAGGDYWAGEQGAWRQKNSVADWPALDSMADLWDRRIMIMPGVGSYLSAKPGEYGEPTLWQVYWYEPNSTTTRPYSHAYKRNAFRMLAEGGYAGFVSYLTDVDKPAGQTYKSDQDVLRSVTQDPDITWRDYKLGRYAAIQNNLDNGRCSYLDPDEVVSAFLTEFNGEIGYMGTGTRSALYRYLQRVTDDFSHSIYETGENTCRVSTAEEFIAAATAHHNAHIILTGDLDFSAIPGDGPVLDFAFTGGIAGGGHSVRGLSSARPLFQRVNNSCVTGLTLEGSGASPDRLLMADRSQVTNLITSSVRVGGSGGGAG